MSKVQQVRKQNPAKPDRTNKTVEYGSRILNTFKLKKKLLIKIVLSFQNRFTNYKMNVIPFEIRYAVKTLKFVLLKNNAKKM